MGTLPAYAFLALSLSHLPVRRTLMGLKKLAFLNQLLTASSLLFFQVLFEGVQLCGQTHSLALQPSQAWVSIYDGLNGSMRDTNNIWCRGVISCVEQQAPFALFFLWHRGSLVLSKREHSQLQQNFLLLVPS
jgi:hypothetical protein